MTKHFSCLLLLTFLLFSCSSGKKDQSKVVDEKIMTKPIPAISIQPLQFDFKAVEYVGKGILLSDTIRPLNSNMTQIKIVPELNGRSVIIQSISDQKFYASSRSDFCELYPYVKVTLDSASFWVFGSNVYEFNESNEHRMFSYDNNFYNLYISENFGMGEVDNGELTGCIKSKPLVIKTNYNDGYRTIKLGNVKYPRSRFPFATLNSFRELDNIEVDSAGVTLSIMRQFMEDEASFEVSLTNLSDYFILGEVQNINERMIEY